MKIKFNTKAYVLDENEFPVEDSSILEKFCNLNVWERLIFQSVESGKEPQLMDSRSGTGENYYQGFEFDSPYNNMGLTEVEVNVLLEPDNRGIYIEVTLFCTDKFFRFLRRKSNESRLRHLMVSISHRMDEHFGYARSYKNINGKFYSFSRHFDVDEIFQVIKSKR